MPSSYTAPYQLEQQFTGENVNTWGVRLNTALGYIADLVGGVATVALTGDYTLATSNTGTNDTRTHVIKFTGTGPYVVTLPSHDIALVIWNACSAALTFTTGGGATYVVDANAIVPIFSDGTNVKTPGYNSLGLKEYIDSVVVGGGASLPSVSGNSGKFLTNNGTTPSWAFPTTSNLSDIATYTQTATNLAAAFAVAL